MFRQTLYKCPSFQVFPHLQRRRIGRQKVSNAFVVNFQIAALYAVLGGLVQAGLRNGDAFEQVGEDSGR